MIRVYYGEGHGKSTAALGIAIQAACSGKSVIAIQFLKGKLDGEKDFLTRLEPEIKLFRFAKSDEPFDRLSAEAQEEERINLKNGFNYGKKVIATGGCDMVVLDEFLGLVDLRIITIDDIREMIAVMPEDMTLILTGRVLTEEIRRMADEIYNITPEKQNGCR